MLGLGAEAVGGRRGAGLGGKKHGRQMEGGLAGGIAHTSLLLGYDAGKDMRNEKGCNCF